MVDRLADTDRQSDSHINTKEMNKCKILQVFCTYTTQMRIEFYVVEKIGLIVA